MSDVDFVTQAAFSLSENKGVYALLIGSGLSRTTGIPTGWEITIDLVRRYALAQGEEEQPDWATWYRRKTGSEPNYSALLEMLASSPEERRAILDRYIEPDEQDRQEGRKIPTPAHHRIASLVESGHLRVILTTNFDRLMENALRDRGIEPTVISSLDSLLGAEPLVHARCTIIKIHGDYKDTRILNTESELASYPSEYNALLDRILDEYGMIVCGWSGEWDHALRAAFLRAANRRYTTFWAARGDLGNGALEITKLRRARVIPVVGADEFFSSLQSRVETLERSSKQNPLSIEVQVGSTKRFLSSSEYKIQLDELMADEAQRTLERMRRSELSLPNSWDRDLFRTYIARYEAVTETLASMAGVLGRWGNDSEFLLVQEIIQALHAESETGNGGLVRFLNLRSYPAALVFAAYGIGLTKAERWRTLHRLFTTKIDRKHAESERMVETLFSNNWRGTEDGAWKDVQGLETHKMPFSEHLLRLLQIWGKRFVGLSSSFDLLFERYEVLGSLAYLESTDKIELAKTLNSGTQYNWIWMPTGRLGWNLSDARKIFADIQSAPLKDALKAAGFGHADDEFISLFIQNHSKINAMMRFR